MVRSVVSDFSAANSPELALSRTTIANRRSLLAHVMPAGEKLPVSRSEQFGNPFVQNILRS